MAPIAPPAAARCFPGGLDSNALQRPKRFSAQPETLKSAAALTIMATALIDTGSRMDDVISEEFKGTGNMEVALWIGGWPTSVSSRHRYQPVRVPVRRSCWLTATGLNKMWIPAKVLSPLDNGSDGIPNG